MGKETGKHSRHHIWSAAWQGNGAKRLEELSAYRQARTTHHDQVEDRPLEKGSGCHSNFPGWEWSVFSQTNNGTVSRATMGRLLRDRAECIWAFSSAVMPSSSRNWIWNWNSVSLSVFLPFSLIWRTSTHWDNHYCIVCKSAGLQDMPFTMIQSDLWFGKQHLLWIVDQCLWLFHSFMYPSTKRHSFCKRLVTGNWYSSAMMFLAKFF